MAGIGTATNPVALTLFVILFFQSHSMVAVFGAMLMFALWIQGDPWLLNIIKIRK